MYRKNPLGKKTCRPWYLSCSMQVPLTAFTNGYDSFLLNSTRSVSHIAGDRWENSRALTSATFMTINLLFVRRNWGALFAIQRNLTIPSLSNCVCLFCVLVSTG